VGWYASGPELQQFFSAIVIAQAQRSRKKSGIGLVANARRKPNHCQMDEGGKRAVAIMAAILTAMHMRTAGDWFGTPSGSPETDKLIAASVQ
jgi:hypothetical protein